MTITREHAEEVAEHLKDFLVTVDIFCLTIDPADLEEALKSMCSRVSTLDALPFPETMRKADVMRAQADTLAALVNLFQTRRKQLDVQRKPDDAPGRAFLKAMGLE